MQYWKLPTIADAMILIYASMNELELKISAESIYE